MSAPMVRIGDVSEQIRGVTYGKGDASSNGGPEHLPILRAGNIGESAITFGNLVYVPAVKVAKRQLIRRGDVLIAASSGSLSTVGKAAQATQDFAGAFGAFCKVLRPCERVDARYFGHFFRTATYRRHVANVAAGANINNLRNEHLDELAFRLPSFVEQQRIAAVLDQVDALRATRREAIALLEDLAQVIFFDMFGDPASNPNGWQECDLGEVILEGPQNGLYKPAGDYGDGVPILRIDSFQAGKMKPPSQWRLVNASLLERERYGIQKFDIVINRVNSRSHLGKSVMVGDVPAGSVFESNMMRIRVDPSVVRPVFIERYLQSGFVRRRILESAKDAVNQSSINQRDVRELPAFVPSMKSQCDFEERLERIRGNQGTHRTHLAALDELFASLQHRAFSGTL